jgi:PAS domain S-box-containing protein
MLPKSARTRSVIQDGIAPSASAKPALRVKHKHTSSIGSQWSAAPEHTVQFYADDDFLVEQISGFVYEGLTTGEACVVIATQNHRERLEQRLTREGLDMGAACEQGMYTSLDAAVTLAQFMTEGSLDQEAFNLVVGGIIEQVAYGYGRDSQPRQVRAFGEMVALLWAEGDHAAAIRLEEMWNELRESAASPSFSLFCAYPMSDFASEAHEQAFREICATHTQVIPDERYTALAEPRERLRAITLLQQQASSLAGATAGRKAAEERERISEHLYRHLFEASTDGILVVDPATHVIIEANQVVADLLGVTLAQLIGRNLLQIGLFPDQESAEAVWREMEEQQLARREALEMCVDNGQTRYVEFVGNRFQVNSYEIIQCHLRDITDRKRAEEAQRQLEVRKDAFISMASHELRTPVTSLKAFTQVLQRRLQKQPDTDPQVLRVLDRIDEQINRQTRLISDLLDLSRMQAGYLALHETWFDFDGLVRETLDTVQPTTQTHTLRLEGATHAQVYGDRERLGQALINLLTNAIKYSPRADSVLVTLRSDREWAEVTVRDFGIGIAPKHQKQIFERFYQVDDPQMSTYPGLGIGLYIAQTIMERHGGRLWVESSVGKGSAFHCDLSLLRADGPPESDSHHADPQPGSAEVS